VSARNIIGESSKSTSLEVIPIDIPSKPQTLKLVEATDKIIKISWTPPESNNGSPITGYKVYKFENNQALELAQTADLEYTFTVIEVG
jgi:hypothetical protein